MSKTKIDKMVARFLGWKLPPDFAPDAGISFDREYGEKNGMPSGTNLFHADQARQMFEHALGADEGNETCNKADNGNKAIRTNLHAYTEQSNDYPAYISINREVSGALTVTVRSRGNGGRDVATIEMSPEQLEQLATDVIARLNGG